MSRVLMYEDSTALDLFSIELDHELHMPDTLYQLIGLTLTVWDEGLELAEGHTGWASYEN